MKYGIMISKNKGRMKKWKRKILRVLDEKINKMTKLN